MTDKNGRSCLLMSTSAFNYIGNEYWSADCVDFSIVLLSVFG